MVNRNSPPLQDEQPQLEDGGLAPDDELAELAAVSEDEIDAAVRWWNETSSRDWIGALE